MATRTTRQERGGREAILLAAIDLLDDDGTDGFTARAVAARAGVSATAIYRHFADLETLRDAVLADGWRRFTEYLEEGSGLATPLDRLHATGDGYLRFAVDHPAVYRALFLAAPPASRGNRRGGFPILVERIADCQRSGVLPGDDPEVIALALWSSVHGLAALRMAGHLGGSDRAFLQQGRALVRLVTRLRPETPGAVPA